MLCKMPYSLECPSVELESAVLDGSPPSSLCIPNSLVGRVGWEMEKVLILCKLCSALTETSLCFTVSSSNPKHSPILPTMKQISSIPDKTRTASFYKTSVLLNAPTPRIRGRSFSVAVIVLISLAFVVAEICENGTTELLINQSQKHQISPEVLRFLIVNQNQYFSDSFFS